MNPISNSEFGCFFDVNLWQIDKCKSTVEMEMMYAIDEKCETLNNNQNFPTNGSTIYKFNNMQCNVMPAFKITVNV